jgi:CubicO group peptidase (beta-lactamase class C family)
MDRFETAAAYAAAHEIDWARDPATDPDHWGIHRADPPPWNRLRGPVLARGPASGTIVWRGREVAAWGEPDRADLTFSVAKTYLAMLAGVAHDRGLIPDPDEPVRVRAPGIGFDDAHNAPVTWTHLLQQTSEWQGSCFGVPDTVDRYRSVAHAPAADGRKGDARPLRTPGTWWEYNDVRINQLALALLHVFREPLPTVFEASVLRPAGATGAFRWIGYDDAWVDLPDRTGAVRRMQSVPGGTHWGGGVAIGARDQARLGALLLAGGQGPSGPVLSPGWVARMGTPCPLAPYYGLLLWLNGARRPIFPAAGPRSVFMIGAGGHLVWVDPVRELVAVARWLDPAHTDRFVAATAAAADAAATRTAPSPG